jgi:hypothetical protein
VLKTLHAEFPNSHMANPGLLAYHRLFQNGGFMGRFTIVFLVVGMVAAPACAADFDCSNPDAEISCSAGACTINTNGFTPMILSRTGKILSICAYSGCWNGPTLTRRLNGSVELLFARVSRSRPNSDGGKPDGLSVIYDRASKSAQMHWGGFSSVMECKSRS